MYMYVDKRVNTCTHLKLFKQYNLTIVPHYLSVWVTKCPHTSLHIRVKNQDRKKHIKQTSLYV